MTSEHLLPLVLFIGIALLIGLAVASSQVVSEPPYQVVLPIVEANVAVMPFDDLARGGPLGRDLRARVEAALTRKPGVKVFSRTNLDLILQEQQIGALGLIEPTTALQIGRLTGVNKIVTGSVLGVHLHAEAGWAGLVAAIASALLQVPVTANELRAKVSVQFQIIDAQTGRVDAAETISEEDYLVLQNRGNYDESMVVVAKVLDKIADIIASRIQAQYTEEIRYGMYKSVKPRGKGLEGIQPTNVFTRTDGQAILLVFAKRVRPGATFYVEWRGPDGTILRTPEQPVSDGQWLPFSLPVLNCASGQWTVRAFLSGQQIISHTIVVH